MNNKKRFNQICKNIKSIKIQGARNIALAGLKAYNLHPSKQTKKKLLSLRPTEPFLINILEDADKISYPSLSKKIKANQNIINKQALKLIKSGSVLFTHCHSSTVIKSLIYAKKRGKKFEVYVTETRPLYQGRKTASALKRAGIKVTMFVDSAASIALTKSQGTRDVDLVLFGTDAVIKKGAINKVGSGMFSQIAKSNKIPVYILADSMKYISKIKLEQRDFREVWKTSKVKIRNPAFELIKRKYITGIISELGTLAFGRFLKEVRKKS